MRRLSFIITFTIATILAYAQNDATHGADFKVDCKACHHNEGWDVKRTDIKFDHSETDFILEGRHESVDCKSCHISLVFSEVKTDCFSCHEDVHNMSVGNDCMRCHTSQNWLVDYIPELHEENGFPLIGAHNMLACADCHKSETNLRWDRLGNECSVCHMDDYQTAVPSHQSFSTDCNTCHDLASVEWDYAHFGFPIYTGSHSGEWNDCLDCHLNAPNFQSFSCINCHEHNKEEMDDEHDDEKGYVYDSNACLACHPDGEEH